MSSAARSGVVPAPAPAEPIVWQPRSARAAAEQILAAVDHFTHSVTAMNTICAALDPAVAPMFGADPADPDDECFVPWFWFGDENVPIIRYSRHSGLVLLVRGPRAVFRTRLSHVFYRGDNLDPPRATVTARGAAGARRRRDLAARDPLAPLMPLVAASYRGIFTDRLLATACRSAHRPGNGLPTMRDRRLRSGRPRSPA